MSAIYCIVFDAIPSGLKCLFKGTVNNDKVSLRSDIAIKGVTITDKRWNHYFIYIITSVEQRARMLYTYF